VADHQNYALYKEAGDFSAIFVAGDLAQHMVHGPEAEKVPDGSE
jgi:hypothetical protein